MLVDTWKTKYEKLTQFVIPRSAQMIKEDGEYQLWTVSIFRKVSDDFKNACRENK